MVKTQKIEIESNGEDKTQPKREPPEKLGKLIELLNRLEPNVHLSSLRVRSEEAHNWKDHNKRWNKYKKPYEKWTDVARDSLEENLEGLSIPFQNYIWGDAVQTEDHFEPDFDIGSVWAATRNAVERYENFCRLREQFDLIADSAMKHPSMLRELNTLKGKTLIAKKIKIQIKDNLERIKKSFKNKGVDENDVEKIVEEMHSLPLPFSGEVKFQIDAQGIMKSNASELVEAIFFSEKDVEILRIRKCLICEKIYWAERFESFACNSICGNKLRESVKVKVVRTQEEKDAANKRKRKYNLTTKIRKLTKQYKDKVIKIQNSAFFDSTESDDSFKLAKGTTVTITKFDSNENSENYPIRCIVRSEEGQEVFFTLPNDKKTPFRIKLKLGAN